MTDAEVEGVGRAIIDRADAVALVLEVPEACLGIFKGGGQNAAAGGGQ